MLKQFILHRLLLLFSFSFSSIYSQCTALLAVDPLNRSDVIIGLVNRTKLLNTGVIS